MKLSIIGTGYVGLVSGTCLAELGHEITCADIDRKKIQGLKRGIVPIYEIGLEELLHKNVKNKRLSFTTSIKDVIQKSDVIFNAVGTPEDKKTGNADLRYVYTVAESFGKHLNRYKLLVNKSTVPVGTADEVTKIINRHVKGNVKFEVVSNPEFLREGSAVKDFLNPERVVIGVSSEQARKIMDKIYRPIARIGRPIVFTDVKSAELIKYASNAFLATKISFVNELANFCEKIGNNIKEVTRGMGLDSRIGSRYLHAGIGYGGSCFPKDVKALLCTGGKYRHEFKILSAVDKVNQKQKLRAFDLLKKKLKRLRGGQVAIWGLSFKPRTDDIREAPAIDTINNLLQAGVRVHAFDPIAEANMKREVKSKRVIYHSNAYTGLKDADALLILTEWDEFRVPNYAKMRKLMKRPLIIDGRNVLDRQEAESEGFEYVGIGA